MSDRIKALLASLGLVFVLAALTACGGGTDATKAQMRLVNASTGYTGLDMRIDDSTRFSAVAYGETASYVEADPAKVASVVSRPGSATALASFTPPVAKNRSYTVLAYGVEGGLKTLVLDDNTAAPASGKTLLRVVNAAPDTVAYDVYLTGGNDTLADATALPAGAAVGTPGNFATVDSATWRLRVTGAGSKADLRLDVSGVVLGSQQVATLVLTPGRGGVLVNALLLLDRGAITQANVTQARVRVAAGVTDGGAVTASVGGTTLMNGTAAPAVGVYSLVAAGTPAVTVAANGVAAAATTATLLPGGDYTVLVYGPATAPLVQVLEDDNRLPADSTTAKVRLVHGVANVSTPLALTADFAPVAAGVAPGRASAYAAVAATTTAAVSVTATGLPTPIYSAATQTFAANHNYSLFVVGSALPTAVGILRQDR